MPPSAGTSNNRLSLANDLVLPTLLFTALGGMTWAVRGCSGFGAVPGCIFAGIMWGAAWWYLARDPVGEQSRRYASGWVILAITFGIGISGARGWMQWPAFFRGELVTKYDPAHGTTDFVPISRIYGFVWLFIAGMPWAGLGACLLAWCGSLRETRAWHWAIRIACGIGGAFLARYIYDKFPQYFLPLYGEIEDRYHDLKANPNLQRLINDNGSALTHMGYYLGFLLYEVIRREWKNVVLILTVGIINGAGWALCQNWQWAAAAWPKFHFNWWRCWESSGGLSIGIAYGIAYFLVNRRMSASEQAAVAARRSVPVPSFEWLLIYLGLTSLLAVYVRYQMSWWGSYYFAIVLAFGAAYYLLHRRSAPGATSASGVNSVLAAVTAVALTAGLIALLFAPITFKTSMGTIYVLPVCLGVIMALGAGWCFLRRNHLPVEGPATGPDREDPNIERFSVYIGLLAGLGLSIRNGLKGWFNIYYDNERYWSEKLWQILGPIYLVALIAIVGWILSRPLSRGYRGPVFRYAYGLIWLVLLVQNIIAQLITGPRDNWDEVVFSTYYLLLFATTAVIVHYYRLVKSLEVPREVEADVPPADWQPTTASHEPGSVAIREIG
jgi:hypothetical protein